MNQQPIEWRIVKVRHNPVYAAYIDERRVAEVSAMGGDEDADYQWEWRLMTDVYPKQGNRRTGSADNLRAARGMVEFILGYSDASL